MYICLCQAITDCDIRESVDRGVSTFRELTFHTGCATQCGSCERTAREVLEEAVSAREEASLAFAYGSAAAA